MNFNNLKQAIIFPFTDDDWIKKFLIGAGLFLAYYVVVLVFFLIAFIPAIAFGALFYGYQYEIVKRVRDGHPQPLPDWDIVEQAKTGFPILGAYLLLQLPAIIFALVTFIPFYILVLVGSGVFAQSEFSEAAAAGLGAFGFVAIVVMYVVTFLLSLASGLIFFGGYLRYTEVEEFKTFFQIGKNLKRLTKNVLDTGSLLIYLFLVSIAATMIAYTVIGAFFVLTALIAWSGHLIGDYLREEPEAPIIKEALPKPEQEEPKQLEDQTP